MNGTTLLALCVAAAVVAPSAWVFLRALAAAPHQRRIRRRLRA